MFNRKTNILSKTKKKQACNLEDFYNNFINEKK